MGSEAYAEVSLADIADFRNGKAIPPEKYTPNGKHPVFGSNGQIACSDEVLCPDPTIVIGRVGAYCGCVHYVPTASWVTDNAIVASPQKGNDLRYLYYLLGSLELERTAIGSAQPLMTQKGLKVVQTKVPPLPEQKAIAHILGSLDDKIELNRQMNATLEAMAQALFKSWFVDFDPVIDNALRAGNPIPDELAHRAEIRKKALADGTANEATAKEFPAAFKETEELGWIPEGWEDGKIGDIAKAIGGFAFKSKAFKEHGYPVIKIKNIVGDGTVSSEGAQCIDTEDANKALKFALSDGDLLMAMTGATVGKIGLVVNEDESAYLNQRVAKLVGRNHGDLSPFLFCFFKDQKNFDSIVSTAEGSAQPNISSSGIESVECPVPPQDTLSLYEDTVSSLFEKWISNHKKSKTLTKLRDTLLPKLISRELRITEAEQLTQEALA